MVNRLKAFFIVVAAMVLISVGSPSSEAITISVDGSPGDWGAMAPLASDPEETDIPADYNLESFYVTNNLTEMFFRLDVYGTPTLAGDNNPFNPAFYQVYLDTDQNRNTGTSYKGIGVDRIVKYDYSGVTISDAAGTVLGSGSGAQDSTTEISASLADLGLTTSTNVSMFAYLDNGGSPPEDLIPDTIQAEYEVVPVPEPETLLLLGIGIIGLLVLKKKELYRQVKKLQG